MPTRSVLCAISALVFAVTAFPGPALAQPPSAEAQYPDEIECVLDASQQGVPLPRIFLPGIDLSGRGFHADVTWPQNAAAATVLDAWEKEIGFKGMYRLQFNLWEISQLDKNKALQDKLLANYQSIIKRVSDAGGTVILNLYSVPKGLGKVLDKTSSLEETAAFKQQIKEFIRYFSCVNRYNVWYEVWCAPDLDDFFLGRKNEYFALYRCVAEAVKELQAETKVVIPVGGPSTSWWFRSFEESTIATPERSLIYELIRFCYHNKLPLDFITWHAYSTDPQAEREKTGYNKRSVELMRDWLSYFGFPRETPLIVDEWNFDNGFSNVLAERDTKANICASYFAARLRNMYDSGLDYQVYFSLEDFQENKEGVVRNVGAFWYQPGQFSYNGGSKCVYNVFRMLATLEPNLAVQQKASDEFSGVIATKGSSKTFSVLAYNYADPEIFRSYVSRNIGLLGDADRQQLVGVMVEAGSLLAAGRGDPGAMKLSNRVKTLLKKAQELSAASRKFASTDRRLRVKMKNLPQPYILQRYVIDGGCSRDCPLTSVEEKEVVPGNDGVCEELVTLKPYSVTLLVLKPRPTSPVVEETAAKVIEDAANAAAAVNATAVANAPARGNGKEANGVPAARQNGAAMNVMNATNATVNATAVTESNTTATSR